MMEQEHRMMDHYHVSGLMSDDEGYPALTLEGAIWEIIDRARMEEDHRASAAYSMGDEQDDYSPGMEDRAAAWIEIRIADQYKNLADDLSRFDRYLALSDEDLRREEDLDRADPTSIGSPKILPPIYFMDQYRVVDGEKISLRLAIEGAARRALGIDAGYSINESYRDLFDLDVWDCPREIGWDEDGVAWDRDYGPNWEDGLDPYPPDADDRILADLGLYRDPEAGEIREMREDDPHPLDQDLAHALRWREAGDDADSFLADHVQIIAVEIPSPSDEGGEG